MALLRRKSPAKLEANQVEFLVRSQDIEGLERILLDPKSKGNACRIAAEGLLAVKSPDSWDIIANVMVTCQGGFMEEFIQSLEAIRSMESIRVLGEGLGNRDQFIRSRTTQALSKQHSGKTMSHLLRAARDPEPSIQRLASRIILRRVETNPTILAEVNTACVEGILDLMDDRWAMELLSTSFPQSIRCFAARRLGNIGGAEACQTLISVAQNDDTDVGKACWQALEACHHIPDYLLLPLMVDPRPEVKSRIIPIYARFSDINALDLITGMARDVNPAVRISALRALKDLAEMESIAVLEQALDDLDDDVRVQAMQLLCAIDESTPELARAVQTYDGEVRRLALVCLANRGVISDDLAAAFIEFIYKGASCTDLSQRGYLDSLAATAKTLGKAQSDEGMMALMALANSTIRRMRRAAIQGLMEFEPQARAGALACLVDSYDPDVVKNVAFGLHEAEDAGALLPLIRTSIECRGKPMVKAKELIKNYPRSENTEFLVGCLTSRWPSIRRFSAEQLKSTADEAAIPALLTASHDDDVEVQLAVFEALGPFAGKTESVTERLLEALTCADISVRQAACEGLGEARCQAAVPHLIKALHNFFLRPRASDALRRIGDRKGFLAIKRLEIRERLFKKKPNIKREARH